MKKIYIIILILPVLLCCEKEDKEHNLSQQQKEIVFYTGAFNDTVISTKATAVTELSSFNVSAVTGAAGSETAVWTNVAFSGNNDEGFKAAAPGKWWPSTDASYRFYAANSALTFTASGATVAATNATDVVCAYAPAPSFSTKNDLLFEHIFARLGQVTVSAASGYTISGVSIKITPKTGGTYNLRTGAGKTDGTGWSATTEAGSPSTIASATGTNANDIYLVPGTYTLTASWSAQNDFFYESISNMTVDVELVAGKTNNISTVLSANIGQIEVSLSPFETEGRALECRFLPPTFAGLQIAPSPLHWNGTTFEILDDDWNHDSYGAGYGTGENDNDDSYYFTYNELGKFFDSRGENFGETGYPVRPFDNNNNKVSYHGYDDWRAPTVDEWRVIFGGDYKGSLPRPGSTVNGTTSCLWAVIQLEGVLHAGTTTPLGILLFPDNADISGVPLSGFNNKTTYSVNSGITNTQLQNYLDQGCAFLPASGWRDNYTDFSNGGEDGYYWSGTASAGPCYYLLFLSSGINPDATRQYYAGQMNPVRLVRTAE